MRTLKRITVLFCIAALFLSGCYKGTQTQYVLPESFVKAESGIVDETGNVSLIWDEEAKCVLFQDKISGKFWGTTPYDFYRTGEVSYSLSSSVVIDYYDPEDNSVQTEKSYECIEQETISSQIKDQTISITYYFTGPEITVTLHYALEGDHLVISLDSNELVESGKTTLINVSVAPFLCSTKNTDDKNSYLFLPVGSGALMYTDDEPGEGSRDFSGEVYGNDPARTQLDNPGDEEPIRLPCFGVADGNNALFAIIESGEGAAKINATAGFAERGYSNVYSTFNVRGYNNIEWNIGDYHGKAVSNDVVMLNKTRPKDRVFKISYYSLSGENANYNGMAKCYRSYLQKKNLLVKSNEKQKPYQVSIIGGAQGKDFILGVPYESFIKVTSFQEALEICRELSEANGMPAVLLKGFGQSGVNVGKIGGGFSFASDLGSSKDQKQLEAFCKEKRIPLYTNFDLIRFSKGGVGFQPSLNAAQTANDQSVSYFAKKPNVRTDQTDSKKCFFLERDQIEKAVNSLLKFCDQSVSGVALDSLSSIAYSDYRSEKYMLKDQWVSQSKSIISDIRDNNHNVFSVSANAYVAGTTDGIGEVPLQNGNYDMFDEQIPFYAMVYAGSVPLYSVPLNLSAHPNQTLLSAVEAGVFPSFLIGKELNQSLSDNEETYFYAVSYDNNRPLIQETVKQIQTYYNAVAGATIIGHHILTDNVTETVFENGISVIVNRSDKSYTFGEISIPAESFAIR